MTDNQRVVGALLIAAMFAGGLVVTLWGVL